MNVLLPVDSLASICDNKAASLSAAVEPLTVVPSNVMVTSSEIVTSMPLMFMVPVPTFEDKTSLSIDDISATSDVLVTNASVGL